MSNSTYRLLQTLQRLGAYALLSGFAFIMLFPFIYMVTTSLKEPADTFRYPPRLLPRTPVERTLAGFDDPLPFYYVTVNGQRVEYALVERSITVGEYQDPNSDERVLYPLDQVVPSNKTLLVNQELRNLYNVPVNGVLREMLLIRETAAGRFVNPADPTNTAQYVYQNIRTAESVEQLSAKVENYVQVFNLNNLGRSLTNTTLVTLAVVIGQLITSVVGGYAFARLKFPGRDSLFVFYLGTIMIPFVMLIVPLYQLMTVIGWVDKLAALIVPWIFTAYGTFLMRQFFVSVPKEIEEAALMDGASRLEILWRIFIPASVPALATQATFTFLYAWNSFFWPLVIINTGNEKNHVLTLALNVLRGRASDSPNLILAGAAIAILPPLVVFILAQRFFIESATSSGVKG